MKGGVMRSLRVKLFVLVAVLGLGTAMQVGVPAVAWAANGSYACSGGSIPAGSYKDVTVNGTCSVDQGNVTVSHNLIVSSGAELLAAFGGSDLQVGHDLTVGKNAVLVLGCEPDAFTCFNDNSNTMSTSDRVGHDLTSTDALAVLVHHSAVGHDAAQSGGGGGVNCDSRPELQGSPAYATYEDNSIGHDASIVGWQSCWLGFIRNTVSHDVTFNNNVTADPDGNEVVTNSIDHDLSCAGNAPAPQVGDSAGSHNRVGHRATGQCAALA
jgi:hypothetical protein